MAVDAQTSLYMRGEFFKKLNFFAFNASSFVFNLCIGQHACEQMCMDVFPFHILMDVNSHYKNNPNQHLLQYSQAQLCIDSGKLDIIQHHSLL